MSVLALLLAAGGSTRLGQPKQLLEYQGETLIRRAARLASESGAARVLVVLGAHANACSRALQGFDLDIAICSDWPSGMGRSLAWGIATATDLGTPFRAALVLAVDQPWLEAQHLSRLIEHWRQNPDVPVACSYAGVRGIPAVLPRSWWPDLLALEGDRGAGSLLRSATQISEIECPELAFDIDTARDLARLRED